MWGSDTNFRVNLRLSPPDFLICKCPRLQSQYSGPRNYIHFRKSVAWLAMLNRQESGLDHLTASVQP